MFIECPNELNLWVFRMPLGTSAPSSSDLKDVDISLPAYTAGDPVDRVIEPRLEDIFPIGVGRGQSPHRLKVKSFKELIIGFLGRSPLRAG